MDKQYNRKSLHVIFQVLICFILLLPTDLMAQTEAFYDNGSVGSLVGGAGYTLGVNFTEIPANQQVTSMRFFAGGGGSANQVSFTINIYAGPLGSGTLLHQQGVYVGDNQWYQLDFSTPLPTSTFETISITASTPDYFGIGQDNNGASGHSFLRSGGGSWTPRTQGDWMIRFTYEQAPDNAPPAITSISHEPQLPEPGESVTINASVADVSGLSWVRAYYRAGQNSAGFDSTEMQESSAGQYSSNIGSFPEGTQVQYYIKAQDASPDNHVAISHNGGSYYAFTIPSSPPLISTVWHQPENPTMTDDIQVLANISDASGIQRALLFSQSFEISDAWRVDTMTIQDGAYYAFTGPFSPSDTVYYYVTAEDIYGNMAVDDNSGEYYSLVIHNDPPLITSEDSLLAFEDQLVSYAPTATDPQFSLVQFDCLDFPSWMSWDGTEVSGTPTQESSDTSFVVVASDGYLTDTLEVLVFVSEVNDPPLITGLFSELETDEDQPLTLDVTLFQIVDPDNAYPQDFQLTLLDGDNYLVSDLTILPAENYYGTLQVSVQVSDGEILSDVFNFPVTVGSVNDLPEITSTPNLSALQDQEYIYVLSGTDVESDTLVFSLNIHPAGMTLDSSNVIHWTPGNENVGTHSIEVSLADEDSATVSQAFIITVDNQNDPPEITAISDMFMPEDAILQIQLLAEDPDDDTLTFNFVADTSAVMGYFSEDSLVIHLVDNWYGTANITVSVSDGFLADSTQFLLTVEAQNDLPSPAALLSPPDSSTFDDLSEITFEWLAGSDIDGDVVQHALQLMSTVHDSIIITQGTSWSIDLSEYENSEDYEIHWRVLTIAGVDTLLSELRTLYIQHVVGLLEETANMISEYELQQNFPNPFNPSTTITYALPQTSMVSLIIYDVAGNEIIKLESASKPAGRYEQVWDGKTSHGRAANTGVYFARLHAGGFSRTIKMLYLK